ALCAAGYNANDILIINGDLTERGCNSLEVIRYIMELSEKNTVYTVMGNVDHFIYLLISDPGAVPDEIVGRLIREKSTRRIVHEMCQELGIKVSDSTNIGALRRHFAETYKREVDFLRSLPTIIETQSFVLAHGGIAHEDYRELDAFCCMKNDRYMGQGITLTKPCIVGHWPTPLYNDKIGSANPVYDREKRIISIDGGCELNRDGQLNMLVFPSCYSSDFTYVAFDNMETVIALDRQKENHDTLHIRFGHNDVKILNPGEEYSLIRHLETGREMEVYNKYLFESDGQDKCDNYSDYLLDVYPGDTLKVTYRTTRGIIAKKDGISGHYIGRIKE
ncbi:MAG: serine/threonine protein phosphatase, partial [Clostridiales bacterium]|nr:serine/threonine protein phosphatase [Clostridiales bacterium]